MAKPRNCSRCRGSLLTIEENEMFGGWLVICLNCGWANEGGDRQDAIREWNEAHGGNDADREVWQAAVRLEKNIG